MTISQEEEFHILGCVGSVFCERIGRRIKYLETKLYVVLHQPLAFLCVLYFSYLER